MDRPAPQLGTDVIAGRFALCDPIAAGGSGTVWRAWDLRLGRFCAAKVMRRRESGDVLRFAREQSMRLDHRHVLTPYSWAAEDEHVVIASELAEGGSLGALIRDHGPLAEASVVTVLDQLLDALAVVHAAGLVHRDVKPGNVLVHATGTGPMHLLLADFGLAIGVDDPRLTQFGLVIGTTGYLAPEVARGQSGPTRAQDLFAAGRSAQALLRGEPAVREENQLPVHDIADPHLRAVVATLTASDPYQRFPSAGHARAALAGARRDPRLIARTGAVIDVVGRLRPLPADWDIGGERRRSLAGFGPDITAPGTAGPVGTAAARTEPVGTRPIGTRPIGTRPIGTRPAGTAAVAGGSWVGPGEAGPGPGQPAAGPRGDHRGRRHRRSLIAAGAVVVAGGGLGAVAATLLWLPGTGRPADGTVVPVVSANQACSWQQEGDPATTPGGRNLVCTLRDGAYRWRP